MPHAQEDAHDADQDREVEGPMIVRGRARDRRADQPGRLVQRGAVVRDRRRESPGSPTESRERRAGRRSSSGPSEKKKPTLSGRCPSLISLRVVLSIAPMWSASKAWRMPSVYAVMPTPMPKHARRAEARVLGATNASSRPKPIDVQGEDDRDHRRHPAPLGRASAPRDARPAREARHRGNGRSGHVDSTGGGRGWAGRASSLLVCSAIWQRGQSPGMAISRSGVRR